MNIKNCIFPVLAFLAGSLLFADVVELKDGKRIEGIILSENEDSIEIQVGQNEAGTVRQVLIIHASEINSWVADKEGRVLREKGGDVQRLGGTEYVERLLQGAEKEISIGNYDGGIQQFGEAAELATRNLQDLKPEDRVEALKIRAHALRLQLAALEGKSDSLEKKSDSLEDEMQERAKKLEQDLKDFEKDKKDYLDTNRNQAIQLGERHKQTDLGKREEELIQRQLIFNDQRQKAEALLDSMAKDRIKTGTQIKLVKERVDQARDDARNAERALRRR